MKTLQEKLDLVSKDLEIILWDLLDESEDKSIVTCTYCNGSVWLSLLFVILCNTLHKKPRGICGLHHMCLMSQCLKCPFCTPPFVSPL